MEQPQEQYFDSDLTTDIFMLPIEYLHNKEELSYDIINDLELLVINKDGGDVKCLYDHVFDSESIFGEVMKNRWAKYYTTDINFLKDSQKLYKKMYAIEQYPVNEKKIQRILNTVEETVDFEETHHYIKDVYFCEDMNKNESIMMWYSIFLVTSPLLTLCLPLIILIMPFIIIKSQGFKISIKEYMNLLMVLLKKVPLGKILEIDWANANILYMD